MVENKRNIPPIGSECFLDTKDQLYYTRLIELRNDLLEQVQILSEQALQSSKEAGEESADIGSDNFSRETELILITKEEHQIKLINEAIERLKNGSYGICMTCNKNIQQGRLEAIPYAKYCINCKKRLEEES